MKSNRLKMTVAVVALSAAISSAYSFSLFPKNAPAAAPTPAASAPVAAPRAGVALPDLSSIVAQNGPAVVNISVSGMREIGGQPAMPQLDPSDPFYDFFRHFGIPQPRGEAPVRALGSGFIIKSDGTILTNAHVVDGADEVTVKLTDKREYKAKVLGMDKASDVAVLKIDAKDLPVVRIGSAANARVGDWVLAIGSPFGFENSATAGIVSAKSRSLPDGNYVPFIQTDVAVNPGNSGGPLFNMNGEVIGINSQIYSRSGGYQGLSFAIPIEVAMNVEQQIVTHGKVERGRIGVAIQEVNQSLADSFGLKQPTGALVSEVEDDSPAAKAGLRPGDVILGINGKDITSSSQLPVIVANIHPGDKATLKIWRDGGTREVTVKVGKFMDNATASNGKPEAAHGRLGVAVRELTPDEKHQAKVRNGVLIQDVAGKAARAGLQPGDIILSVNGTQVTSAGKLQTLIDKAGKHVALLIERGENRIFVPIDLG